MRELVITIIVLSVTWSTNEAIAQQGIQYGLTFNQGFSLVSNSAKMVDDFFPLAPSVKDEHLNSKGVWHTNSLCFDTYFLNDKLVASIGFQFFHYKLTADSLYANYVVTPYYGQRTYWISSGMPFIKVGSVLRLSEKFSIRPSISFGMMQLVERFKTHGVAYNPSGQQGWDDENQDFNGFNYGYEFEVDSYSLELATDFSYDYHRWSFTGGLSYYYYRNLPVEGYHGLHLNIGCSVKFGSVGEN
jgi:hypothetical protein